MHIKTRLRHLLKDVLVKHPESKNHRDQVLNRDRIKNVLINPRRTSEVSSYYNPRGGFIRISAQDESNAQDISALVIKHKDDLKVESVNITDQPVPSKIHQMENQLTHSVMIRVDRESLVRESIAITLKPTELLDHLMKETVCDDNTVKQPERIVIDFSSPNIAKPFHFGHLKSTLLGNYLSNLNRFLGRQVTRLNYIGDWGLQYGLLSSKLDMFDDEQIQLTGDQSQALKRLVQVYVEANELGEKDAEFYNEARRNLSAMESEKGGNSSRDRWEKIRQVSISELNKSYSRLGIEFDAYEYESEYVQSSIDVIQRLRDRGLTLQKSDGVTVIQLLKSDKLMEVPLIKSDGSSLYISRDLSAALRRKEKYEFDQMLYVVGADQDKHFFALAETLRRMGESWADDLVHVKTGKVLGMSTRSGDFLLLSDIIDRTIECFSQETKHTATSKLKDANEQQVERVATDLALSALFIYDMRRGRTKNYKFSWEDLMRHRGNHESGIQLQTTYARLSSLVTKAHSVGLRLIGDTLDGLDVNAIGCEEGMNLVSHLNELDNSLHHSYCLMDPKPLVDYALDLCVVANRARNSRELMVASEADERKARTRLTLFASCRSQLEMMMRMMGLNPQAKV